MIAITALVASLLLASAVWAENSDALPHYDPDNPGASMTYFIPPQIISRFGPSEDGAVPVMLCVVNADPNARYIAVFGRKMSKIQPGQSCAAFMWQRAIIEGQSDLPETMLVFQDQP